MSTTIQIRRDTAANWISVNPVLALGEEGLETDSGKRKIGDGTTAWAALVYTPTARVSTLSAVSGAVTLDLSTASVFVVNLTGNVTSLVFSNAPVGGGQSYEIHFVQDATGSRTLAGVNAAIKLAGGSLTLTTTASKRDVVTVRQITTTTWFETGRSLNI